MIKWYLSDNGLYETSKSVNGYYLIREIGEDKIRVVEEKTNSYCKWKHDLSKWEE